MGGGMVEPRDVERRAGLFALFVLVVFAVLAGRLGHLQLAQGQVYENLSQGNRLRLLPIVSPRGEIYDRNGVLLACNRPSFTVSLLHMGVEELDRTLPLLGQLLEMEPDEITRRIDAQRGRWYEPIRLRSDINPLTHTLIEEHRSELPGVVIEPFPVRYYPHGSLAAHVIGYLGEIELRALESLESEGYRSGDVVGKMGVEAVFDRYLRGKHGGRQVEVDARGRPYRTLGQIDPVSGNNVLLTIDSELQRVTEQALDQMMQDLRNHKDDPMPNAQVSAAVVLDPRNGEILALASRPGFDPNIFATRISADDWRTLESDPLLPLLNRSTMGEYQPGSSFKMITAIAALETQRTSRTEVIDVCTGFFRVTARDSKACWAARYGGHGPVTLTRSIAESCNVAFYELGRRIGIDDLGAYTREFGLGAPTGLQDLTSERKGLVPSRAWKRENYPQDPQWWLSETLDAAIGQGFHMYTPLQMAVYVSMLGNGGIQYRPRLVRSVSDPEGTVILETVPEELRRADVSLQTLDIIREGMTGTVEPGGTAAGSFVGFPIAVAGKTGTVEQTIPGRDSHGWFVAYAPADAPTIAIAVIVEQGGGGSRAAAPVARKILDQFFGLSEPQTETEQ